MAATSGFQLSIHNRSVQLHRFHVKSSSMQNTRKFGADSLSPMLGLPSWSLTSIGCRNHGHPRNDFEFHFLYAYFALAPTCSWRQQSSKGFSAVPDHTDFENVGASVTVHEPLGGKGNTLELNLDRTDYLVQILHQSAQSFSLGIRHYELVRKAPELTKAWIGVNVHAWHKHISYQAAIYSLFQVAMETDEHGQDLAPAHITLSPTIHLLEEYLGSQLNARDPKLVKWFKSEKFPVLAGYFTPLLKRWSAEYTRSDVAGIILAISSCVAVGKLGAGRISCPMLTLPLLDVIEQLMDLLRCLVSIDSMYSLASEAGLEQEFLRHFGSKVLSCNPSSEFVFWLGLVKKKLAIAFQRESVIASLKISRNTKEDLATLGLFAFLGRKTRLFLSNMGIKDLDEPVNDFLSYLECGSLFIYPELSSISLYQLFMEVVTEELGWLDFYGAVPELGHHGRRRSRQTVIQAKKEIILSTVFNICLDWFLNFSQFSKSTCQTLDAKVVEFLLRSQNLLNICLEDYWAAYDQSCEILKPTEASVSDLMASLGNQSSSSPSIPFGEDVHQRTGDLLMTGITGYLPHCMTQLRKATSSDRTDAAILENLPCTDEMEPVRKNLFSKLQEHADFCKICKDMWMGTRLLFIDMFVAVGLLRKQICRHMLTKRERKILKRMLIDLASIIPVAILMLLPVSAIGHAAILAAIKKYIPSLIPTPYSSERLDVLKQLERTKKMDVKAWSNL